MTNRELDALVAEKVMGLNPFHFIEDTIFSSLKLPNYSTNIADAWLVVEKLKTKLYRLNICQLHSRKGWAFSVNMNDNEETDTDISKAICLAALKAIGYNSTPGAARDEES